jgi:uncharacterized protein YndB with AHSA1/START domain
MTEDGRYALRFERALPHPPEKVWRAIATKDGLRGWFVSVVDYDRTEFDPAPDAKLVFAYNTGADPGHGEVTACDPPNLLEYTWDGEILRWELTADGAGGCRLVFVNVFDEQAMARPLEEGWTTALNQLEDFLADRE